MPRPRGCLLQYRVLKLHNFSVYGDSIPLTSCTTPYNFWDKFKAMLELLQEQNIIVPVTEPTKLSAPIMVASLGLHDFPT